MSQENSATDESLARQVPLMETARLRIRRLQIEDAPAMLDILSDDETVRYWGRPAMTRLQEAERYTQENLDWMNEGHCLYWGLEETASGKLIGTCALLRIDWNNQRGEVGFLLHRNWWRTGIMSETY